MSSKPSFYRVSIDGVSSQSGIAPRDGFIDHLRVEQYLANSVGADGVNEASLDNFGAVSFANCLAKRRANIRFNQIIAQIGLVTTFNMSNVTASGSTATTSASTFSFDMLVDHGDGSLATKDENSTGVISDPIQVIIRTISRAMIANTQVHADVLDPTPTRSVGVYGANASVARYGVRYQQLSVGPLFNTLADASTHVTVTSLYQPNI